MRGTRAIMAVVGDRAEAAGYNALILRTDLSWREVSAIRALSRYLHQIRAPFSQDYMSETLRKNTAIARLGGRCAPIVASAPNPISISPSPVTTRTRRSGRAIAKPSPTIAEAPIAPHR